MAKPRPPSVHAHSRPTRSESQPSAIWPTMPVNPTTPSAHAALSRSNPMSSRYLVWCACTMYQTSSAAKKPTKSHQNRAVRIARPSVQSTDAHARERDADGETAPAHEPVRQEERMADVGHEDRAAADERAQRDVQVPRPARQRRQR